MALLLQPEPTLEQENTVVYTLPLDHPEATLDTVGGKGASLARLANAGLPVPDGFHITTAAYRRFVQDNDLQPAIAEALKRVNVTQPSSLEAASNEIRLHFLQARMPVEVAEEIERRYRQLGEDTAVAVRSSATAEDLPELSFAGQQETFLNVRGVAPVQESVKHCWASLWTARAIGYRAQHSIDHNLVSLAVVVQQLVAAEASGVLFTANPINGQRGQAVLNAAWGLGEAIVGGLVTPDTIVVEKASGKVIERQTADKLVMVVRSARGTIEQAVPNNLRRAAVLDDQQAVQLVQLGVQIDELYGRPLDIEWTLARGEFAIVQARPITALPELQVSPPTEWPIPLSGGIYARGRLIEFLPDPLRPLFGTLGLAAMNEGTRRLFAALTNNLAAWEVNDQIVSINDYAYLCQMGTRRQKWMMTVGMLRMTRYAFTSTERRWRDEARPRYLGTVQRWQANPLPDLAAADILRGVREIMDAAVDYYTTLQSGVVAAAFMAELIFSKVYDRFIRQPDDPVASTFLLGFDSTPLRAEKSLFDLAEWARSRSELAAYLARTPAVVLAAQLTTGNTLADWPEWQIRFQTHLQQYGHTIYDFDFSVPVPADNPAPLLETCKMYLSGKGRNPYIRQQAAAERREQATAAVITRHKGPRRKVFLRLLRWARNWAPKREDARADMGLGYPLIRQMLRELGRRLVQADAIGQVDDIFWLVQTEVEECVTALEQGQTLPDLTGIIPPRQAHWQMLRRIAPPVVLPQKSRLAKLMPWNEHNTGEILKGYGASAGRVSAIARVLHGPEDFDQMQPGDVLVAAITTPAWTPLFAMASAIVTDIGGPLSHGSIVAREYGIPAVLGTSLATKRIKSGQPITVDGTAGTVTLTTSTTPAGRTPHSLEWTRPNPKAMYARGSLAEHLPNPVSPLFGTLGIHQANLATAVLGKEFLGTDGGADYQYRTINGYMYMGFVFGPKEMWSFAKAAFSQLDMMLGKSTPRWQAARTTLDDVVTKWEKKAVEALSPTELLNGAREVMQAASRFYTVIQSGTLGTATSSEIVFTQLYNRLIKRQGDPDATVFLFGFDTVPLLAEKALFDLALFAKDHAALCVYLSRTPADRLAATLKSAQTPDEVPLTDWLDWQARFQSYLAAHGRIAYEFDFANPTLEEAPEPLLDAIKMFITGQGNNPYERQQAATQRREEATARILARVGWPRRGWFKKALGWAQRTVPVREDSLADMTMGHPVLRRLLNELGHRLTANGAIQNTADIYWLEEQEVEDLIARLERGEIVPDHSDRIPLRKAHWQAQRQLNPPAMLPENSRWAKMLPWARQNQEGQTLKGVGTSAGKVTATARVLFGPEDFSQMQPGDVLVAVTTTPAWTPLFAMAAAVVTDIGGPLSHSSIVAREYGIPAVMATSVGTRRIRSGQSITVDGSTGTVTLAA